MEITTDMILGAETEFKRHLAETENSQLDRLKDQASKTKVLVGVQAGLVDACRFLSKHTLEDQNAPGLIDQFKKEMEKLISGLYARCRITPPHTIVNKRKLPFDAARRFVHHGLTTTVLRGVPT
jgi:hypothetical protein